MKLAVMMAALVSAQGATACGPAPGFVEMQASDGGSGRVFIDLPTPPVSQPFEMGLIVCGSKVRDLEVSAVMPAHQHGMNYDPDVVATDPQRFDVSGMVFHMPGLWRIEVEAEIAGQRERYLIEATAR